MPSARPHAAPVVAVATALMATAVIPYGPPFSLPGWAWLPEWLQGRDVQILIADIEVGLLFIFAVTALGVYGLVLAGGTSTRMGRDKALLERGGRSQLAHAVEHGSMENMRRIEASGDMADV